MGRLSKADHARLDELTADLGVLRIGAPSAVRTVLPELRAFAQLESMVCMCPVERTTGWAIERFDCDNFANDTKFRQLSIAFLERAPRRFGYFDPIRPEPGQRNVVIDLEILVPRSELEKTAAFTELMEPLQLDKSHIIRALICDGGSLLAWFGAFHPDRADTRQQEIMIAMIPALRRRLLIERRLAAASLLSGALETALEQLGAPAFVVNTAGRIFEANDLGKALLETRRTEVASSLQNAIAERPSLLSFELTRLRDTGRADHWLAIQRTGTGEAPVARALSLAVTRFKLTVRQRDVLELLLRGDTNTTIAATLRISERAVEQHVSAMLDRTGVDNRSTLISLVLLGT
jgi:DNA-binding CsgD family transcriptional regulator